MGAHCLSRAQLSAISKELKDSIVSVLKGAGQKAILVESCDSNFSPTEFLMTITPTNPRAAPIEVRIVSDFGAYLHIGRGAIFEVPFTGKRYTDNDFIEEITNLVSGVVYGGFEEEVFMSQSLIVGARGEIKAGVNLPKETSDAWMKLQWNLLKLFCKREKQLHVYESYLFETLVK
jgi:hypothetical protein